MRRFLLLPILAGALFLSACAPPGGVPLPGGGTVPVSAVIEGARQACGFVPLAQSVYDIISKKDQSASTVSQIVNLICTAIKSAPMAEGRPVAVHLRSSVTGRRVVVRIRGSFVR